MGSPCSSLVSGDSMDDFSDEDQESTALGEADMQIEPRPRSGTRLEGVFPMMGSAIADPIEAGNVLKQAAAQSSFDGTLLPAIAKTRSQLELAPVCTVDFTFENLDYDKVMDNPSLCNGFTSAIQETISLRLRISTEMVDIALARGSVIASATIRLSSMDSAKEMCNNVWSAGDKFLNLVEASVMSRVPDIVEATCEGSGLGICNLIPAFAEKLMPALGRPENLGTASTIVPETTQLTLDGAREFQTRAMTDTDFLLSQPRTESDARMATTPDDGTEVSSHLLPVCEQDKLLEPTFDNECSRPPTENLTNFNQSMVPFKEKERVILQAELQESLTAEASNKSTLNKFGTMAADPNEEAEMTHALPSATSKMSTMLTQDFCAKQTAGHALSEPKQDLHRQRQANVLEHPAADSSFEEKALSQTIAEAEAEVQVTVHGRRDVTDAEEQPEVELKMAQVFEFEGSTVQLPADVSPTAVPQPSGLLLRLPAAELPSSEKALPEVDTEAVKKRGVQTARSTGELCTAQTLAPDGSTVQLSATVSPTPVSSPSGLPLRLPVAELPSSEKALPEVDTEAVNNLGVQTGQSTGELCTAQTLVPDGSTCQLPAEEPQCFTHNASLASELSVPAAGLPPGEEQARPQNETTDLESADGQSSFPSEPRSLVECMSSDGSDIGLRVLESVTRDLQAFNPKAIGEPAVDLHVSGSQAHEQMSHQMVPVPPCSTKPQSDAMTPVAKSKQTPVIPIQKEVVTTDAFIEHTDVNKSQLQLNLSTALQQGADTVVDPQTPLMPCVETGPALSTQVQASSQPPQALQEHEPQSALSNMPHVGTEAADPIDLHNVIEDASTQLKPAVSMVPSSVIGPTSMQEEQVAPSQAMLQEPLHIVVRTSPKLTNIAGDSLMSLPWLLRCMPPGITEQAHTPRKPPLPSVGTWLVRRPTLPTPRSVETNGDTSRATQALETSDMQGAPSIHGTAVADTIETSDIQDMIRAAQEQKQPDMDKALSGEELPLLPEVEQQKQNEDSMAAGESGEEAPFALPSSEIVFSYQNLDYDKMPAETAIALKQEVRDTVAQEMNVHPMQIQVSLSRGSVRVNARVWHLSEDSLNFAGQKAESEGSGVKLIGKLEHCALKVPNIWEAAENETIGLGLGKFQIRLHQQMEVPAKLRLHLRKQGTNNQIGQAVHEPIPAAPELSNLTEIPIATAGSSEETTMQPKEAPFDAAIVDKEPVSLGTTLPDATDIHHLPEPMLQQHQHMPSVGSWLVTKSSPKESSKARAMALRSRIDLEKLKIMCHEWRMIVHKAREARKHIQNMLTQPERPPSPSVATWLLRRPVSPMVVGHDLETLRSHAKGAWLGGSTNGNLQAALEHIATRESSPDVDMGRLTDALREHAKDEFLAASTDGSLHARLDNISGILESKEVDHKEGLAHEAGVNQGTPLVAPLPNEPDDRIPSAPEDLVPETAQAKTVTPSQVSPCERSARTSPASQHVSLQNLLQAELLVQPTSGKPEQEPPKEVNQVSPVTSRPVVDQPPAEASVQKSLSPSVGSWLMPGLVLQQTATEVSSVAPEVHAPLGYVKTTLGDLAEASAESIGETAMQPKEVPIDVAIVDIEPVALGTAIPDSIDVHNLPEPMMQHHHMPSVGSWLAKKCSLKAIPAVAQLKAPSTPAVSQVVLRWQNAVEAVVRRKKMKKISKARATKLRSQIDLEKLNIICHEWRSVVHQTREAQEHAREMLSKPQRPPSPSVTSWLLGRPSSATVEGHDLETLRRHAKDAWLGGSRNGNLRVLLENIAREESASDVHMARLTDILREHAKDAILAASTDGTLQATLDNISGLLNEDTCSDSRIENLREQARVAFLNSSLDINSFEATLRPLASTMDRMEAQLENLRVEARAALISASNTGSLATTLGPMTTNGDKPSDNIEDLREHAKDTFLASSFDGSLPARLDNISSILSREATGEIRLANLREQAQKAFLTATCNGRLVEKLSCIAKAREKRGEESIESVLRMQAKRSLLKANRQGTLRKVLSGLTPLGTPTGLDAEEEILRKEAKKALLRAKRNGLLAAHVRKVMTGEAKLSKMSMSRATGQGDEVNATWKQARDAFFVAKADGTLPDKLQNAVSRAS